MLWNIKLMKTKNNSNNNNQLVKLIIKLRLIGITIINLVSQLSLTNRCDFILILIDYRIIKIHLVELLKKRQPKKEITNKGSKYHNNQFSNNNHFNNRPKDIINNKVSIIIIVWLIMLEFNKI